MRRNLTFFERTWLYPILAAAGESQRLPFLKEFETMQFRSPEELQRLQQSRLQRLLEHAFEHCSFYRSRLEDCGIDGSSIRDGSFDFSSIEPLTKSEIQQNARALTSADVARYQAITDQTGGSTGQPVRFLVDRDRVNSRWAAAVRHDRWAGLTIHSRRAVIWGAPQDLPSRKLRSRIRQWLLAPTLWLDTGCITEQRIDEFLRQLRKFRPRVILAYANSAALVSRIIRDSNLKPWSPESIICSAEVLTDEKRTLIEDAFDCPVFDRYGCREFGVVASECEQRDGLHVMAEGLYVEIVNSDNRPVGPGEFGHILVTDLLNRSMPMIRYRIGDMGAWKEGECACGRGLPRLQQVSGRVTDFVRAPDGRLVSGVFLATYVIARRPALGQVQIVQRHDSSLVFRLCPGPAFDTQADGAYLIEETRKHVGDLRMTIELVDAIEREPSGKFLFCKSELASTA